jgi:hypothetical protein
MKLRRWIIGIVGVACLGFPVAAKAQLEEVEDLAVPLGAAFGPEIETAPDETAAGEAPAQEGKPGQGDKPAQDQEEPETPRKARVPLPPRYMLLKLLDGSLIAGELSVNEIQVKTEFGELTVPVAKIKSFTPGLDSNAKAAADLKAKLKDLESDDYATREQAHKDLAAMGPKIAKQLAPFAASENAEVKRHVGEILKDFEQQAEEASEDEAGDNQADEAWINQDTIETTDFTVLGKISPAEFKMASKYGPLTIGLGEIVQASRPTDEREGIRRSVAIPGQNLAQRSFKATGVRVQDGDRVTIMSSGNITMSPWGSNASSGPDGMPNYGWYVNGSIPGGALVYRIGDKGQIHKAGSRVSFIAKTSGTLQLAVGMTPEYANEGYNFPGEYKARIKVDPQ